MKKKERKPRSINKALLDKAKEIGLIEFTQEELDAENEKTRQEEQKLIDAINEEKNELTRLCRIVNPVGSDVTSLYRLYQKYIDPKAKSPTYGCEKCPGSIRDYWVKLTTWFHNNKNKFNI